MSDTDILVKLVPSVKGAVVQGVPDEEAPAYLVGVIRNVLGLGHGEHAELTIEAIKDGFTIHGQRADMSFRWSVGEDGYTYLKAWGIEPCKTWDFLKRKY